MPGEELRFDVEEPRSALLLAGEALLASEERFREMAENIGDVFYIIELGTGRLIYVSPAYGRIWGSSVAELEANPAQWTEAVVSEDRARLIAARDRLEQGIDYKMEYSIRRPDGDVRWIEDRTQIVREPTGRARRAVGVAVDITSHRHLEGQLLQAQKMEAVGQLAGGVAHDFNNVLTIVIGYARLLLDEGTLPQDAIDSITQIFIAGNRAANLTRQLLVFSRKQPVNRRIVDLNLIASEFCVMLRRLIGEHLRLNLELSTLACFAEADAGMIEQVLMNLAVNARDAMPRGGTLTIATEHLSIVDAAKCRNPDSPLGEFICLSVRDTGVGMAPAVVDRVFEPFFTTKEVGKGTGLGLSMVFGIVRQHRGWIEIESEVGVGTRFRILVPAKSQAAAIPVRRQAKVVSAIGGTETILLVEDEPSVRDLALTILSNLGYRVLQARSGAHALEVWQWHGPRISLLLTDLVMPDGVSGVDLADRLRKEKPTLKVLLTSGYANESIGESFRPPSGTHFIGKPYRPQELMQTVRDALDDNYDH